MCSLVSFVLLSTMLKILSEYLGLNHAKTGQDYGIRLVEGNMNVHLSYSKIVSDFRRGLGLPAPGDLFFLGASLQIVIEGGDPYGGALGHANAPSEVTELLRKAYHEGRLASSNGCRTMGEAEAAFDIAFSLTHEAAPTCFPEDILLKTYSYPRMRDLLDDLGFACSWR